MNAQQDTTLPDVEIYVAEELGTVMGWLRRRFGAVPDPTTKLRQNLRVHRTKVRVDSGDIPVLIVDGAATGFLSVLFESDQTPWANDLECAREAAIALGCEVRCSDGPWQPGQPEDAQWWSLSPTGERKVHWPNPSC